MRRFFGVPAALLGVFAATAALADTPSAALQQHLESIIAAPQDSRFQLFDPIAVHRFYAARGFRAAWLGPDCTAQVAELVLALGESETHGLDPSDYHRAELSAAGACELETELEATDAWLSLAAHLHAGRVDPVTVEPHWTPDRPPIDLAARLEDALARREVRDSLLSLAPDEPFYLALRETLARYRERGTDDRRVRIGDGPDFRAGDSDPRIPQLRERLRTEGLLDPNAAGPADVFDETLKTAVKAFQRHANLEPDGIVGPMTLHQLNLGAADRVAQLRANLERWRWLPDDLGDRHIEINIADFRAEAHAQGRVERVHRAILGRPDRQTPVFTDRMTYVVLNPWWETPLHLAVVDKLPQFRKDPEVVQRLGYQIQDRDGQEVDASEIDWSKVPARGFPYRVRQRPGPQNALGHVKMMSPNEYQVYLHDTPAPELFKKERRAFSSGCIRIDNAEELVEWVLAGTPGWDRARIDSAIASGEETKVQLVETIPVHIIYLTAVPDEANGVRFVDDVYGRDAALIAALDAPPVARSNPPSGALPVSGSCYEEDELSECGCSAPMDILGSE